MVTRRLRLVGVALLVVAGLVAFVVFGLASSGSHSTIRLAPALPPEALSGKPVTLAEMLSTAHGRPTLVVFWASWCGPCAQEAPAYARVAQSAAGRGRIVGVDWSDPEVGSALAFTTRYGWKFPDLRDPRGTYGRAYGLISLPATYVLSATGRIEQTLHGPQTEQSLDRALG